MIESLLIFFWAMLISMFSIPTIISVAHSKRILDQPDFRKHHGVDTPRLGGLGIFAGFMTGVAIFGQMTMGVQQLLAGSLIIFFVGVKDDINGVSVFKKFFVQVLAAGIVLFYADIRISSFQGLFGVYDLDIGLSYAFTFLVILCVTNAVNLIDGINGLAGTIVLIICFAFGIAFYFYNQMSYAFVAFALAGGILGFLRYNFGNAKVFMGDTGALVSGFIISIMAIHFIEMRLVPAAPALTIGVLFIPIFDTIRVFIIRVYNGVSPFMPDRNHIHHYFGYMGLSHSQTVITLALINIGVIALIRLYAELGNTILLLCLGVFAVVFSVGLELLTKKKRAQHA
ncbi:MULTISPECIES: glycosyltransferase family 4 protein [Reichenbachiella]|uniref:UDP-N-acetylmuramyl pentapeptide phosphotransferase/UDP-N-acetylglucosamine-1-phosphate transferase n=1 Tax=Reichenbachiella agariperforans TaxID=156994 RepID=A0A1M6WPI3_REIAG|nr:MULTISPECIES: MraY family glycosyltransferase [Reichenbachiella]RJE71203.1 undecaprenyl-phosphate alpha-N-acetylglucosaminyl 1-phosphate transferase [Reichenbachiella sp. MSK19-1]SHK95682.1 UDP-N-acetylmuramyl pentapeptide phosphotransferase/UDP-N-acetylglucosamine-1-phosphate transferase [Reichenbachiella agariperforans]